MTPWGTAGIAVVDLWGADVGERLTRFFSKPLPTVGRLKRGMVNDEAGPIDDVLIAHLADLHWRLSCHGGGRTVQRVLAALCALEIDVIGAQALMEKIAEELIVNEVQAVMPTAATRLGVRQLLFQQTGGLSASLKELARARSDEQRHSLAQSLLESRPLARCLLKPSIVALAGPPNAGKSTLLNALLGHPRAIVSERPGTTRDCIAEPHHARGIPVEWIDTAGLRSSTDPIERAGVARAKDRLQSARLIIFLIDASQTFSRIARDAMGALPRDHPVLIVANKCDLPRLCQKECDLSISAATGHNLDRLREMAAVKIAGEGYDRLQPLVFTDRQEALVRSIATNIKTPLT